LEFIWVLKGCEADMSHAVHARQKANVEITQRMKTVDLQYPLMSQRGLPMIISIGYGLGTS
jgi:hypothetical protein